VVYTVSGWIFGHGGHIFKIVKEVFTKFEPWIIILLDTLTLIHIPGFLVADAKIVFPAGSDKKRF